MVEATTHMGVGDTSSNIGTTLALERLRAAVVEFGLEAFAVIDGGLFDDLPGLFRKHSVFARSLFLDHADAEVEKAGPWLVALGGDNSLMETVFNLVGNRPAAVFWSCRGGETVLYRHLRTLNLVRIPPARTDGSAEAPNDRSAETSLAYESVMFRHWDPRVLAALLPVLEAAQFSRVLGPATEIALNAEDYGGLKRIICDEDWPPTPAGMLKILPEQMRALEGRMVAASHRRIARYLRAYAPARTAHLDDAALLTAVRNYEREAKQFGVRNEDAIGMWAYMSTSVTIPLLSDSRRQHYLTDLSSKASPDERVYKLFEEWTRIEVQGFTR